MRAAVRHEYGPPEVLRIEEIPTPVPRDDEVRIRVRAASVNLGDWELLTGRPPYISVIAQIFAARPRHPVPTPAGARGLFRPKHRILGGDVAGVVDAVGRKVTTFRPGDEVFGDCSVSGFGAFAESVCVPVKAPLLPKPPGMTFEQAAAIPQAAFIAVKGVFTQGKVGPGQKVLVNGAGGGAGTFAVQMAKSRGAEVTGVDGPTKLETMRAVGADHVLDYTRDDFTRNGERYDLILDLAAYRSIFDVRRVLAPRGLYLMAGGAGKVMAQTLFLGPLLRGGGRRIGFLMADYRVEDLEVTVEMFEKGTLVPRIDRSYPLEETAEALRRVGEKQGLGKVLVTP